MKSGWYIAKHSGGLDECLETENRVSDKVATLLVGSGIYTFYAYDDRIKADRYLICNIEENLGLPQWLHFYGKSKI